MTSSNRKSFCSGAGFTLVEMLAVLAILAILAAIAMPNLADVMAGQRLRAAGTDFVSSLLLTRSEAIKRNADVEIVPVTAGDWTSGWRVAVVATNEQVDRRNPPGLRVAVTLAPGTIVYARNGRVTSAGTVQVQLSDTESGSTVAGRCVTIDPSGLPRLEKGACS